MNRDQFTEILKANEGILVVKFTAEWCAPCKKIKEQVAKEVATLPAHVKFMELDVDKHFDVYACMKSKKQVNGIPALLAYGKGNITWYADRSISGSNATDIANFFKVVKG